VNWSAKSTGIVAIVVVVVMTVLLGLTATAIPVDQAEATPTDVAVPPDAVPSDSSPVSAWYDNPAELKGDAGTFIKSQPIADAPEGVEAYRMMYVSEDVHNNEIAVTALVLFPKTPAPPEGFPLIAYGHGTTGSTPQCGLSEAPFTKNTPGFYVYDVQLRQLLDQGYAVVASDYENMGTKGTPMYLMGKTQAQNVLDSVRAIWETRDDVDHSRTMAYGHSQGGLTALSTAYYQQSYAPEIPLAGSVSLAPGLSPPVPFALEAVIKNPEPTGQTSFTLQLARSWSAQFPDQLPVEEMTTEYGRTVGFQAIEDYCGSSIKEHLDKPMNDYLPLPVPDSFYELSQFNTIMPPQYETPVLLIQGMQDEAVLPAANIAYVNYMCSQGVPIEAGIWQTENHNGVTVASRDMVNDWMAARFDGEPAGNDCMNR